MNIDQRMNKQKQINYWLEEELAKMGVGEAVPLLSRGGAERWLDLLRRHAVTGLLQEGTGAEESFGPSDGDLAGWIVDLKSATRIAGPALPAFFGRQIPILDGTRAPHANSAKC